MSSPDQAQAQNLIEPEHPSSKFLITVLVALLTGGFSLIWRLALHLPALLRKGWEARARYTLAPKDPQATPWPWIGNSWVSFLAASFVAQVLLLTLAALLSIGLGGLSPQYRTRAFLLAGKLLTWPQLLLLVAVLGQGTILAAHTLTHALCLPQATRATTARLRRLVPKWSRA